MADGLYLSPEQLTALADHAHGLKCEADRTGFGVRWGTCWDTLALVLAPPPDPGDIVFVSAVEALVDAWIEEHRTKDSDT